MKVLVAGAAALYDHILPVRTLPSRGHVAEILSAPSVFGRTYFGGTTYNIALTLAGLGVQCDVLHAVGHDFPGSEYEGWLRERGVSLQGIQVHQSQTSGHAFLFYDSEGETLCFSYPGAANESLELEVAATLVPSVDMVVIAPVFTPSIAEVLALTRQKRRRIAVCGICVPTLMPFLPGVEILIANTYEIGLLCRAARVSKAEELLTLGPHLIYETRGTGGSRLLTTSGEEWIPTTPPDESVDPTGAGDAYAGAVLAATLNGLEPPTAGLVGSIAASFVVEKIGCQSNLPDWHQISSRLKDRFPQESVRLPVLSGDR